jgi:hypothetical protein
MRTKGIVPNMSLNGWKKAAASDGVDRCGCGAGAAATATELPGNHVFRLPFGEFFSANVTPDAETGAVIQDKE